MKFLTGYLYREIEYKENNAIECKPRVKQLFPFNLIFNDLPGGYTFLYIVSLDFADDSSVMTRRLAYRDDLCD